MGKIQLYSPFFTNLIGIHRHVNLSIFLTSQYLVRGCGPVFRECVNYAFIWNSKFSNTLKSVYESFGQGYPDFNSFKESFDEITSQKYTCLLFNSDAELLEDQYYAYRAPAEIPNFQLKF